MQTMNERRRPGADVGEAALSGLTGLARDLGIPASEPRDAAEVDALDGAMRDRIRVRARGLAFDGLSAGRRTLLCCATDCTKQATHTLGKFNAPCASTDACAEHVGPLAEDGDLVFALADAMDGRR